MAEQMVRVDGAELCVETFDNPADPGVLLNAPKSFNEKATRAVIEKVAARAIKNL